LEYQPDERSSEPSLREKEPTAVDRSRTAQSLTYYVIEDLIKALDGEIIVRWNNYQDVKAL
jgi:hypothetical protein